MQPVPESGETAEKGRFGQWCLCHVVGEQCGPLDLEAGDGRTGRALDALELVGVQVVLILRVAALALLNGGVEFADARPVGRVDERKTLLAAQELVRPVGLELPLAVDDAVMARGRQAVGWLAVVCGERTSPVGAEAPGRTHFALHVVPRAAGGPDLEPKPKPKQIHRSWKQNTARQALGRKIKCRSHLTALAHGRTVLAVFRRHGPVGTPGADAAARGGYGCAPRAAGAGRAGRGAGKLLVGSRRALRALVRGGAVGIDAVAAGRARDALLRGQVAVAVEQVVVGRAAAEDVVVAAGRPRRVERARGGREPAGALQAHGARLARSGVRENDVLLARVARDTRLVVMPDLVKALELIPVGAGHKTVRVIAAALPLAEQRRVARALLLRPCERAAGVRAPRSVRADTTHIVADQVERALTHAVVDRGRALGGAGRGCMARQARRQRRRAPVGVVRVARARGALLRPRSVLEGARRAVNALGAAPGGALLAGGARFAALFRRGVADLEVASGARLQPVLVADAGPVGAVDHGHDPLVALAVQPRGAALARRAVGVDDVLEPVGVALAALLLLRTRPALESMTGGARDKLVGRAVADPLPNAAELVSAIACGSDRARLARRRAVERVERVRRGRALGARAKEIGCRPASELD
eukprot:472100-Rhodomonas_salina.2